MTAKLHIETPSQKAMAKERSKLESPVTDIDGKVYELKIPDPMEEFDLNVALGREHSINMGLLILLKPLICIQSIDGKRFDIPGTFQGLRAALKTVGTNGMDAISGAYQRYIMDKQAELEDIETLKK